VIGGGVGVGVMLGVGDGAPEGGGEPDGGGEGALADGAGEVEGDGETGALVAGGAGGFTWARGTATDASMHPARIAPPKNSARDLTDYAIFASFRLTAVASSVL
jgi:hypothetical protein